MRYSSPSAFRGAAARPHRANQSTQCSKIPDDGFRCLPDYELLTKIRKMAMERARAMIGSSSLFPARYSRQISNAARRAEWALLKNLRASSKRVIGATPTIHCRSFPWQGNILALSARISAHGLLIAEVGLAPLGARDIDTPKILARRKKRNRLGR